jgi:hypothetical protein
MHMPVSGESRILRLVFYKDIEFGGTIMPHGYRINDDFTDEDQKKIRKVFYEKYSLVMHVKREIIMLETKILKS